MAKVQATTSFRAGRIFVSAGSWFDDDDPVVRNWPTLFSQPPETPVRTTATVPGAVTAPPPEMAAETPVRPPVTAAKAQWERYVSDLGGDPGDLTKSALQELATQLEGG